MAISSMTGFARADGSVGAYNWTWEVRSVNGRGLDLRCRLPPGHQDREPMVRAAVPEHLRRGNVTVSLNVIAPPKRVRFRVDREGLAQLLAIQREIHKVLEVRPPALNGLLSVRGVVEEIEEEEDPATKAKLDAALAVSLRRALRSLAAMRSAEGRHIAAALGRRLREMEGLCRRAEKSAAAQPKAIRSRLLGQVRDLLAAIPALPEERVAQETALLVARADVREELDRLRAHVHAARGLLKEGGGAVGRRLDFLCQELMREANTLCSKSVDVRLTGLGLELKARIEQFREQVQNVE